jgi:hypothetical protein
LRKGTGPGIEKMGNRMTLEEQIKANKRLITKAIRELDRERSQLERDQKRLEMEIKKLGKSVMWADTRFVFETDSEFVPK